MKLGLVIDRAGTPPSVPTGAADVSEIPGQQTLERIPQAVGLPEGVAVVAGCRQRSLVEGTVGWLNSLRRMVVRQEYYDYLFDGFVHVATALLRLMSF
jgi:hypothetical protein